MKDLVAVVAASAPQRGIGYQGQMPWPRLTGDLQHFKRVTCTPPEPHLQNAVVMGRKTWESLPPKHRPLADRINVVLTSSSKASIVGEDAKDANVLVASSWSDCFAQLQEQANLGQVFVIGGGKIYEQSLEYCQKVVYTQVECDDDTKFDTYFPALSDAEWELVTDNKEEDAENTMTHIDKKTQIAYRFLEYRRKQEASKEEATSNDSSATKEKPHDEYEYLNLCRHILDTGIRRGDRTGTGTLSVFGAQMRFDLRNNTMPLVTTKRTFWRGLAEELLWFIKGSTNAHELAAKKIHIWDGNGSREFLDSRGLTERAEGDLGPVYGFQWRHFGAEYVDCHTDYTGQGVDQLAECIRKIKENPTDRRIVMSAWNAADLKLMALPPCHMFCQFYVDTDKNEVSCQLYQRSADMGLGVPFNIASYALLTHMIAHVTGRKAGDLVHVLGDAHIYSNHVDALEEQLLREPRAFPTLRINPEKKDIDDIVYEDFELIGYKPHPTIAMKMAV